MIFKNKKGSELLQNETVKIIIGVICIGFLAYFAYLIYQASSERNEIRQASSTLEEIGLRLEKLNEGENAVYIYIAPRKYYIKFADSLNKVDKCSGEYCLCLCNKENCNDLNVCRKVNKQIIINKNLVGIKLTTPESLLLLNAGGHYEIKDATTNE